MDRNQPVPDVPDYRNLNPVRNRLWAIANYRLPISLAISAAACLASAKSIEVFGS
jgi:hypothetical protein